MPIVVIVAVVLVAIVPMAMDAFFGTRDANPSRISPDDVHASKEEMSHLSLLAVAEELLGAAVGLACWSLGASRARGGHGVWLFVALVFGLLAFAELFGSTAMRVDPPLMPWRMQRAIRYTIDAAAQAGVVVALLFILPRTGAVLGCWVAGMVLYWLEIVLGQALGRAAFGETLATGCEVLGATLLLIAITSVFVRDRRQREKEPAAAGDSSGRGGHTRRFT